MALWRNAEAKDSHLFVHHVSHTPLEGRMETNEKRCGNNLVWSIFSSLFCPWPVLRRFKQLNNSNEMPSRLCSTSCCPALFAQYHRPQRNPQVLFMVFFAFFGMSNRRIAVSNLKLYAMLPGILAIIWHLVSYDYPSKLESYFSLDNAFNNSSSLMAKFSCSRPRDLSDIFPPSYKNSPHILVLNGWEVICNRCYTSLSNRSGRST